MNYETARTKWLIERYLRRAIDIFPKLPKFPELPLELGVFILTALNLGGYYVFMFWGYRG